MRRKLNKMSKFISKFISWFLTAAFVLMLVFATLHILESDRVRAAEAERLRGAEDVSPVRPAGFDLGAPGFRTFAENDYFILEADTTTAEVAFTVKATGQRWYTNPQCRDEDTVAPLRSRLASQLFVHFMNVQVASVTPEMLADTAGDSVGQGALSYRAIDNGVEFTYGFPRIGVEVVLQFTIGEDGLVARIPEGGVRELWHERFRVTRVDMLPFFGCDGETDDGYSLLPDGSGALMRFNNNRQRFNLFFTDIYGPNRGTPRKASDNSPTFDSTLLAEQAYLPLFGKRVNEDAAFLAVITGGAANAGITALTSRRFSSYNQAYVTFTHRQFEFITQVGGLSNNGADTVLLDMTDPLLDDRGMEVTFMFLGGEDANHLGMARRFNEYMHSTGRINTSSDIPRRPFVLDIYGAVRLEQYVWGINRSIMTPLTTYGQVMDIVTGLNERGVENIIINYIGATRGGVNSSLSRDKRTESVLGSRREFEEMQAFLESRGVILFLEYDPINFHQSGNGFAINTNSSRTFFDKLAFQYEFNPVTGNPVPGRRSLFLAPRELPGLTNRFFQSAAGRGIDNISLSDMGRFLYSDFSRAGMVTRSETLDIFEGVLQNAAETFDRLLVRGGNAFTWAYADLIIDAPVTYTGHDMVDKAVPFYGLVLSGDIPVTSTSLNFSADYRRKFLQSMEMGYGIKFTWLYADIQILVDTEYNHLLSGGIRFWLDTAVSRYHRMQEVDRQIGDSTIIYRANISHNVYRISYSNGRTMYVNYNELPFDEDGISIPGKDFIIV